MHVMPEMLPTRPAVADYMLHSVRQIDIKSIFWFVHHASRLGRRKPEPGFDPEKWCSLCGGFFKKIIRKEHEKTKRHKVNLWLVQMQNQGWARMYEGSRLVIAMMENQLPGAKPYMVRGPSDSISTAGSVWWGPWWMGCIAAMTCIKAKKRRKTIRAFWCDPDHVEWFRSVAILAASEGDENNLVLAMVEHIARIRL